MKAVAVILFGGSGTRFGSDTPKQFLEIGGMPLMCHALGTLNKSSNIDEIYVVSGRDYVEKTKAIIDEHGYSKVSDVIIGGATRSESSRNAIRHLEQIGLAGDSVVLIMDGDRPNLDEDLIVRNIEAASKHGAAVTAKKANDSIIYSDSGESIDRYVPREAIYQAQTPQSFRFEIIAKCFHEVDNKSLSFTDEGSLAVQLGIKPAIVLGSESNIKITTKEDAEIFEAIKKI